MQNLSKATKNKYVLHFNIPVHGIECKLNGMNWKYASEFLFYPSLHVTSSTWLNMFHILLDMEIILCFLKFWFCGFDGFSSERNTKKKTLPDEIHTILLSDLDFFITSFLFSSNIAPIKIKFRLLTFLVPNSFKIFG